MNSYKLPQQERQVMKALKIRSRRGLRFLCALCGSLSLGVLHGTAQQSVLSPPLDADLKQTVDAFMQPFLGEEQAPGAIVGISFHGRRSYFTYGAATNDGTAFTPKTLVEIGSCTKVFTSTLFAQAVGRHQMEPDGSIQTYMPMGLKLKPAAREVTPRELANHTSGMPDDPPGLPRQLEMRSIEFYSSKDFLHWVSNWTPDGSLPAPYSYSNAGSGLLGYLVGEATHTPWEQLVAKEITGPLGMIDTEMRPSDAQMNRLAQGHRQNGMPAPSWPLNAWYPAGALRSTATDMLSFGEANLGHATVSGRAVADDLTRAMKLAQTPTFDLPNGHERQGMAWATNIGNGDLGTAPELLKNGGTVGFSTVILLNQRKDLAIFIAVNKQGAHPAKVAVSMGRAIH